MQKRPKFFLYLIITLFLVFNTSKANGQNVFFNTPFDYTPTQLSNFLSSIVANNNQLYFNANDYNFYCYDKNTFLLKYHSKLNTKTNTKPFLSLYNIQKELDEKAARLKHLECTQPDKARIEAQKAAEEKFKK